MRSRFRRRLGGISHAGVRLQWEATGLGAPHPPPAPRPTGRAHAQASRSGGLGAHEPRPRLVPLPPWTGGLMDERILEFVGDLRRAELRISPTEAVDALAASAEVGLGDRETFKATLAATLVKEARDRETFDRIFDLYFLDLEALGEGLRKALGPEDPRVREMLEGLMAEENLEVDELTELLLRGQGSEMEMAIRAGGQNLEHTGGIAGMSGSPVFLRDDQGKDRMIGAFAYGWGFAKDPIAGVQPIEYMLEMAEEPDPSPAGEARAAVPSRPQTWNVLSGTKQAIRSLSARQNRPSAAGNAQSLRPLATPVVTSGAAAHIIDKYATQLAALYEGERE